MNTLTVLGLLVLFTLGTAVSAKYQTARLRRVPRAKQSLHLKNSA